MKIPEQFKRPENAKTTQKCLLPPQSGQNHQLQGNTKYGLKLHMMLLNSMAVSVS